MSMVLVVKNLSTNSPEAFPSKVQGITQYLPREIVFNELTIYIFQIFLFHVFRAIPIVTNWARLVFKMDLNHYDASNMI